MSKNKSNPDIQTNVNFKLNSVFGGICCCVTSCGCCYSICNGSATVNFTKKYCFKLMFGLSSVITLTEICILGKHYQNIFSYNALVSLLLTDIMSMIGYCTFPNNSFDIEQTQVSSVDTEEAINDTETINSQINNSQNKLTKTNYYVTIFLFVKAILYFFINISVIATTKKGDIINNTFIFELVYNILTFLPAHYVSYLNHKINNDNNYYTTLVNIIKKIGQ